MDRYAPLEVTLRQVMYRLAAEGVLPHTPPMYRPLSSRLAQARREGCFPDLIDTIREVHVPPAWPDADAFVREMPDWFRLDRTAGQEHALYVAAEKDTLRQQLTGWLGDVPAGAQGCPAVHGAEGRCLAADRQRLAGMAAPQFRRSDRLAGSVPLTLRAWAEWTGGYMAEPIETVTPNDLGSATLRGYEYQTHVVAQAVLEMLADEAVRHVTCEHIEDAVIARGEEQAKGGLFWEFQQIKMRKATTPWAFRDVLAKRALQSLWRTYGTLKDQGLSYRLTAAFEGLLDPADALVTALARGEGAGNEHCMERVTAHLKGDVEEVSVFLGLIRIQELPRSEDIESRNVAFLHELGSSLTGAEIDGLYAELVHRVRQAMQGRLDPRWTDPSKVQDLPAGMLGKRIGPSAIADIRQRLQLPDPMLLTGSSQHRGVDTVQISQMRSGTAPYEARGLRKDYDCEKFPFHRQEDGMADVFYATHKPTGIPVVLKKLRGQHPHLDKRARMTREIEVGRLLSGHPNAMPVWDFGPDGKWFVMPKAQAVATDCLDDLNDPAALRDLVQDLCSALAAAHGIQAPGSAHGWVHRDIKPSNVLRLDGRWVLADWGIARRPPGQTTHPQRTRVGVGMGSEGFAAPELSSNAHTAGPPADIYSLGQLIGWVVTGRNPQQNVSLTPDSGPWRAVVREATRMDPGRRPATVRAFLDLVAQEIDTPPVPPVPPVVQAEMLRDALHAGAANSAEQLVVLAAAHPDDAALYCDVLLTIEPESLIAALMADPPRAVEIVRAMPELLGTHRSTERGEVDAVILWLFTVARHAAKTAHLHLLEESCNGAFTWDAMWNQWMPQDKIRPWLRTLTGDAAGSVAGALREHPDCARHFSSLADDLRVDHRIRAAVSLPSPGSADVAEST
ncbi:dsDNA nuclease domain-containing protein [Streptomyces sp. NBC_01426]|uniref:dsDNA nuclease domain-containing protein n=1 Tax=Streptomyces sp. NBC_01426 TaxID=2975866 RepID=UPI002E3556EE|nr:dsDNA nuclease domain-containing protein [Streptomyces sp. NBC_01426]